MSVYQDNQIEKLTKCINEAGRFVNKAREAIKRLKDDEVFSCKEMASAKRSSMDLSRVLTDLRKSR